VTLTMTSWRITWQAIAADRRRLQEYFATYEAQSKPPVWVRRGFIAVFFYRIARYCHDAGWTFTARLLWLFNLCVTGADLAPVSSIGSGFIVPYPRTVTIYGTIGERCTFLGQSGIGGAVRGRLGLPIVGDDVVVQPGSIILGAILIGDGARIGPRCVVTKNVPPGAEVIQLGSESL
jgi:serine O-acetyltransferase